MRRVDVPRIAAMCVVGGAFAAVATLATLWWKDRSRSWETPRWSTERFTRLDGRGTDPGAGTGEIWVVAVNPDCGHCPGYLRNAALVRARHGAHALHALVVDHASRPATGAFGGIPVDGLWWDHDQAWRRRWGHRVYGEVLRFDHDGRFIETWPPQRVDGDVPDP